jgi:hypothetical protein
LALLLIGLGLVVPGMVLAQEVHPTWRLIGGEPGALQLYRFGFQETAEIPWNEYEETMTVYVQAGSFAFASSTGEVIIDPPPGGTCIEILTQVYEGETATYPETTGCLTDEGGADCQDLCRLGTDAIVELDAGDVLYIPGPGFCFVCAIQSVTGGTVTDWVMDVSVVSEAIGQIGWIVTGGAVPEEGDGEATPSARRGSTKNGRIHSIPLLRPDCKGRTGP